MNKIHFVTWGHIPPWLNTSHPQLNIVNHRDYIPAKYLPTFNSHTIELNLHRIKGLAEHFVYFNDDVFVTAPVKPRDFFRDGIPCDTFALNAIYFGKDSVGSINGNDMSIINEHFSKKEELKRNWNKWFSPANGIKRLVRTSLLLPWSWFPGFLYSHTSTNLLKSTICKVWDEEEDVLDITCSDKFRQPTNVNQWLFKYWQLAEGNFVPVSTRDKHCYHIKNTVQNACNGIENRRYKICCINDTGQTDDFESKARKVRESFQRILSEESQFEL